MLRLACPGCKHEFRAAAESGGVVTCPQCAQPMRLPAVPLAQPVSPEPEPPMVIPLPPAPLPLPAPANPFADMGGGVRLPMADGERGGGDEIPTPTLLRSDRPDPSLNSYLPPEAPAEARELGKPFALFEGSLKHTLLLFLLAGGAGILGCGLVLSGFAQSSHTSWMWRLLLWLTGLGLGGLAVWSGILACQSRLVLLFPEGLVQIYGKKMLVCRWEEMSHVTFRITRVVDEDGRYLSTSHRYSVTLSDGTRLKLDDSYKNVAVLGAHLLAETMMRQMPRVRRQIEQGQKAVFGPFFLDRSALTFRGSKVAWRDLVSCNAFRGRVRARRAGWTDYFADCAAAEVPNLFVLLGLTDELVQAHGTH